MKRSLFRRASVAVGLALPTLLLAACGGGSPASGSGGGGGGGGSSAGAVNVDMFVPLTGPSGSIGVQDDIPGFKAAQYAINQAGGILGRKLNLIQTDLGADPADSVSAARQMLAQYPGLSGVVGLTSDTAIVSAEIFNTAKVVTITQSGTTQLDHVHFPYVFRVYPSDSSLSVAMVTAAMTQGLKRVAIVFGQNAGSQANVTPIVQLLKKHGGDVVANEALPLDQSSYSTVIAKVLSAHPQVIMYETDPQTAATLFPELLSQENGQHIPVLGTSFLANIAWLKPVAAAVGGFTKLASFLTFLNTPTNPPGSAYPAFQSALLKVYHGKSAKQYLNSYDSDNYDAVMIEALAMDLAHSTNPQVYVNDVIKVVNSRQGQPVTTYAQGLADIKNHKPFYYMSTIGKLYFNKYHSVAGVWNVSTTTPGGQMGVKRNLSETALAQYS
jgi:branched-chain amino acid transport system substrate-binding protein